MSRWRILLILALIAVPFVGLAVLGSVYLYRENLMLTVWWPLFAAMSLGYLLAWYWQRSRQLVRPLDFTPPMEWTERDRRAWQLVEQRAQAAVNLDPVRLTDLDFYVETVREMALELARVYHPGADDPYSSATIPEILAALEHAAHDLAGIVERYLPAGHLLTVRNWRQAKTMLDWYPAFSKAYWLASALFRPVETAQRYLAAQVGVSTPFQAFQKDAVAFLYTAFVHRVGTYLIELHGGRLRVGAIRYRTLRDAAPNGATTDAADTVKEVRITVIGQVKAGKSSLINALLGEQRARTDVLPQTSEVTRYELNLPGIPTRLVVLDTVGYGHEGPRQDQMKATRAAVQQSDVVLLALHARNPARQADADMLRALEEWWVAHPDLKWPPLVGVLTHIDLLSPALEWSPPYDWRKPTRPKEVQIRQAVEAAREQLGPRVPDLVPVCAAEGRVYGVQEELLPALVARLDEARAVALVRCVRAEADAGKVRKVVVQLLAVAEQAARLLAESPRR